ncbi:MAG TPA: exodeoxyribonuclease VII small subunit [Candidatus Scybalousia intestinigallinarum]|nr:exodeoxyribonuclease VII small subunit [Candidatus Scybalousia intestinigallinarum]
MTKAKEQEQELSFEENLNQLEAIVKNLESGNVPLDDAIDEFNKAMKIVKVCDEKLKNAEDSIHKILNKDGKLEDFSVEE